MNKQERIKLHSILTRIADNQEEVITRLDAIEASQVMLGSLVLENETDIKNILHVLEETQKQQRESSGPDLRVVKNGPQAAPKPAE